MSLFNAQASVQTLIAILAHELHISALTFALRDSAALRNYLERYATFFVDIPHYIHMLEVRTKVLLESY